MSIKIVINGAYGRMGQETIQAILADPRFALVGKSGRTNLLNEIIEAHKPDVVVDFTTPETVYDNVKTMIDFNVHPVIGTTGLTPNQIKSLQTLCATKKLGGLIAPNFSIAVSLMLKYAQDCATHLPDVEIIEMHHNQKLDAPSGTALKTAELLKKTCHREIPIHSVRLPGLLAHQIILFGNAGETLTLRQDTLSRQAFMPGVLLACEKVMGLEKLVYGLEQLL